MVSSIKLYAESGANRRGEETVQKLAPLLLGCDWSGDAIERGSANHIFDIGQRGRALRLR